MKDRSFTLRLPQELLVRLKHVATKNHRSLNQELQKIAQDYIAAFEEKHGPIEFMESK